MSLYYSTGSSKPNTKSLYYSDSSSKSLFKELYYSDGSNKLPVWKSNCVVDYDFKQVYTSYLGSGNIATTSGLSTCKSIIKETYK